ncbi:helix-turn-helix domain-containing protein [Nocardia sp. NBC_01730]|uniref:helix-turn-helix transcriptional regulator n=1 Tax=Nocardia sp. NBC_01730 TaxID=2975998 RepID=UPI002E0D3B83|nr:helix-turn-helix domain-containing protein [Nocardia sp. NBC_01730]
MSASTGKVIQQRRELLGLSQPDLAEAAEVSVRQIARYEADEQSPTLPVAIRLAAALQISLAALAGVAETSLDLAGDWWAAWQTWKDGVERIDVHPLTVRHEGDYLLLDGSRARPVADGSYEWRGELRLWDNESLMGWYSATEGATRSKGTIYFALHPHGTHALGSWTGLSYEGIVVRGWGAIAREKSQVEQLISELIRIEGALKSWPSTTNS